MTNIVPSGAPKDIEPDKQQDDEEFEEDIDHRTIMAFGEIAGTFANADVEKRRIDADVRKETISAQTRVRLAELEVGSAAQQRLDEERSRENAGARRSEFIFLVASLTLVFGCVTTGTVLYVLGHAVPAASLLSLAMGLLGGGGGGFFLGSKRATATEPPANQPPARPSPR